MTDAVRTRDADWRRPLVAAFVANTLWINASEVFRYFALVMPMMRSALPQIPDVAPMNLPVFAIWGVWDTILVAVATGFAWLFFERLGGGCRNALLAGTAIWLAIFCIFWLAAFNMNLAPGNVALTALPLAWLEMVVAAGIVDLCRTRFE